MMVPPWRIALQGRRARLSRYQEENGPEKYGAVTEETLTNLATYIKLFASLNRAPGPTWTDATKRKAPHKPLLLLAVLDLVHRGVITSPFIAVTGDLVELNELFNLYWRRI